MLIELDLDEVKSLKITTNQFLLIKFIIDKIDIKGYKNTLSITQDDIDNLIEQNILTPESVYTYGELTNLHVTEKFEAKFKTKDFFDEFFDTYPIYALRPDGIKDYLRSDVSRSRKSYNKIVGKSRSKHEHILECLKFEISTRNQTGKMGYMKRMYKWLTAEEWLLYDEFLSSDKVKAEAVQIYGTDVE